MTFSNFEHTPSPQPTQGPVESTASPSESSVPTLPESMSPSFSLQPTKNPVNPSSQYYIDWNILKCVLSCMGPPPCGGKADSWEEKHPNVEACCDKHLPWLSVEQCQLPSETDFPFPSPSSPPVVSPSPVASTQVYMDWVLLKCVASCEGPPPCGGKAQVWNELFDSVEDCCTNYFTSSTFVTKCLAPDIRNSISPTTVPLSHMPTTTSHWFMNYDDMECVLDNDSRQPWQKLYSSKVICCQSNGVVCT